MKEIYRKRGRTVRYESGRLVRIAEAGEAVEENGAFACRPLGEVPSVDEPDAGPVLKAAREIEALASHPLSIERLLVSYGLAEHEMDGRRWSESIRRIHVAMTSGRLRALVDRSDFDLGPVRLIAEALPRAGARRDPPARLRLAPHVTAALLPALVGTMPMIQCAAGHDGKGYPVEEARVALPPWPNWYRPSYRVRPVRAPLHLRAAAGEAAIDPRLPRAIALLAPVTGPSIDVLCVDGPAVYPTTFRAGRIEAVSGELTWFPYGAGALGCEAVVV
jgi:hypothetical protein